MNAENILVTRCRNKAFESAEPEQTNLSASKAAAFSCPLLKQKSLDKTKYLLADFGTAIRIDSFQEMSAMEGDHRYLPPELRENEIGSDLMLLHKADVYSLGLVALELMTCIRFLI